MLFDGSLFFMGVIRGTLIFLIFLVFLGYIVGAHYRVHVQSTKELQDCYYRGTVVDKGERYSYRWIIADWITADGDHIGRREINAAGRPINRIEIGDRICAGATGNWRGLAFVNAAVGYAYYPTQISFIDSILVLIFDFCVWVLLIVLVVRFFLSLNTGDHSKG